MSLKTVTNKDLTNGVVAEYDARNRLVGLDILDDPTAFREITLEGIASALPHAAARMGETQ